MTTSSSFALINADDEQSVRSPLERLNVIQADTTIVQVSVAGEGNMNCVLRVTLGSNDNDAVRSVIVKQSRPWVAKYPTIQAPVERIFAEERFLRLTHAVPLVSRRLPKVIGFLPEEYLLVMEDLGAVQDESHRYQHLDWQSLPVDDLLEWLLQLHSIPAPENDIGVDSLRVLNHHHIFELPFKHPSDVELDDICRGLADATVKLRTDSRLVDQSKALGIRYLSPPDGAARCMLHGDFYPGSWVSTKSGTCVIDAEFCFVGEPEFDVAVLVGHLILAGASENDVSKVIQKYADRSSVSIDADLVKGWAAIEVIRRILGVAQLPLAATLEHRLNCLSLAETFLRTAR